MRLIITSFMTKNLITAAGVNVNANSSAKSAVTVVKAEAAASSSAPTKGASRVPRAE